MNNKGYGQPFIHKLVSETGTKYIYDVNTNSFLSANTIEQDLILDIEMSTSDIIDKWRKLYSTEQIIKHVYILRSFRSKGYFSSNRPIRLRPPVFIDDLSDLLNSQLQQLMLNITEKCNLRCRYCSFSGTYHNRRAHTNKIMNIDIAMKAIEFYLKRSAKKKYIVFYGGEPLIAYNIIRKCTEYAKTISKRNELQFSIDTNGILLKKSIIDYLVENDYIIQISIDGPMDIHDRYRIQKNGKGSFDIIMRNIDYIRDKYTDYFNSRVFFMVTLAPPIDFNSIEQFLQDDRFRDKVIGSNHLNTRDTSFFAEQNVTPGETIPPGGMDQFFDIYKNNIIKGIEPSTLQNSLFRKQLFQIRNRSAERLGNDGPPNGICVPGVRRVLVDVEGNFRICEKLDEFVKIGDVDHGFDYDKIMSIINYYIEQSENDCLCCWAVRMCSLCYISASNRKEWSFEIKREHCDCEREWLEKSIRRYLTIMETNPSSLDFLENTKIL